MSRLQAGGGKITARLHGAKVVFPELAYTYPLKLLSPRIEDDSVAIVYTLSYGGGLVGGDRISLSVDVGPGVKLLLLSQGSTKVFKTRPGTRRAVHHTQSDSPETRQRLHARVSAGGALFLLPDPVTCFASASYAQIQTLELERGASAVLLDWYTSGRRARGEEWAFVRYRSVNEIWVDGVRVARDATLLEGDGQEGVDGLPRRTLGERMGPYACFACVLLCGPEVTKVVRSLDARVESESVLRLREPMRVVWAVSALNGAEGRVLRVAGKETEDVKDWLRDALSGLGDAVGRDAYAKAFV
ncbi:UreD-domain-containing protein [Vararia minispora EC-137]|uniref:UreD-domain-containing protein n=1 Tax=Vararia minispora EC-137 TaxID=1314806 RepID=A0ACB8QSB4_9AGAM|nr:UreD-domain-containing protein [Vararia minispora EC-137]